MTFFFPAIVQIKVVINEQSLMIEKGAGTPEVNTGFDHRCCVCKHVKIDVLVRCL